MTALDRERKKKRDRERERERGEGEEGRRGEERKEASSVSLVF